jgi:hypothetical protein
MIPNVAAFVEMWARHSRYFSPSIKGARIYTDRMRDQRGRLLSATLGFLSLGPREPEVRRLHRCFDTWRGIGDVVAGMARQELRPRAPALRRSGLAGDVLPEWVRALSNFACWQRIGTEPWEALTRTSSR